MNAKIKRLIDTGNTLVDFNGFFLAEEPQDEGQDEADKVTNRR
jgi:hypothetical protein